MEYDIIIVRAIHIFAGIIWVGFGLAMGLLVIPTAKKMGEQGRIVFKAWFVYSAFNRLIAIAAVTTTVAGLYLYFRLFDGANHRFLTETGSMVLSVGALFGLLAFGHGIALGRLGDKYAKLAESESPEIADLQALQDRIGRNGYISAILMIIAVLGMILPRYL
ncbi:MAG: hypothetical protein Q9P01_09915 [Anaerolineae bacterium]|nr:hypothetical protein [Anaerolineae bacterium]MDQ7035129.1 hypothetical protein [Anaerolineae bacterium]